MRDKDTPNPSDTDDRAGPSRDFAAFSELELERRRNSDEDFDAALFHEAVALAMGKIATLSSDDPKEVDNDHQ